MSCNSALVLLEERCDGGLGVEVQAKRLRMLDWWTLGQMRSCENLLTPWPAGG